MGSFIRAPQGMPDPYTPQDGAWTINGDLVVNGRIIINDMHEASTSQDPCFVVVRAVLKSMVGHETIVSVMPEAVLCYVCGTAAPWQPEEGLARVHGHVKRHYNALPDDLKAAAALGEKNFARWKQELLELGWKDPF